MAYQCFSTSGNTAGAIGRGKRRRTAWSSCGSRPAIRTSLSSWPTSAGEGTGSTRFAAVMRTPNVYVDLSGSGVDRGMLDRTVEAVGASRMVWGSDLTMETGLAKLWALGVIGLSADDLAAIRWRNAARIFPPGSFPALPHDGSVARRTTARAS